jgi:hypothetical protein
VRVAVPGSFALGHSGDKTRHPLKLRASNRDTACSIDKPRLILDETVVMGAPATWAIPQVTVLPGNAGGALPCRLALTSPKPPRFVWHLRFLRQPKMAFRSPALEGLRSLRPPGTSGVLLSVAFAGDRSPGFARWRTTTARNGDGRYIAPRVPIHATRFPERGLGLFTPGCPVDQISEEPIVILRHDSANKFRVSSPQSARDALRLVFCNKRKGRHNGNHTRYTRLNPVITHSRATFLNCWPCCLRQLSRRSISLPGVPAIAT